MPNFFTITTTYQSSNDTTFKLSIIDTNSIAKLAAFNSAKYITDYATFFNSKHSTICTAEYVANCSTFDQT
jgi:hypothetical protein